MRDCVSVTAGSGLGKVGAVVRLRAALDCSVCVTDLRRVPAAVSVFCPHSSVPERGVRY